ncbi:hypothetical protein [Aliamphritea spongicola]|nr:hypothetical protein [Aliamphritea spongicola]
MDIIQLDQPISDAERAALLFAGHLLVYRQRPAMQRMIAYTRELLEDELQGLDPVTVQKHLSREEFLERVGAVQTRFRTSEDAKLIFFDVLRECGVTTEECYYDHFPLRVVPFDATHNGAHRAAIGHHRDTWGSNVQCQQNWWAPVFSLEAERTIAFIRITGKNRWRITPPPGVLKNIWRPAKPHSRNGALPIRRPPSV